MTRTEQLRAQVRDMPAEHVRAYLDETDKLVWLESYFDLPSVCTELGEVLADMADNFIGYFHDATIADWCRAEANACYRAESAHYHA